MARKNDIAARRKIRALEARRDALQEKMAKEKVALAETRAALKQMRSKR